GPGWDPQNGNHMKRQAAETPPLRTHWQPVAFGMALDDNGDTIVLRLSGDADTAVATAIDELLRGAVRHDTDGRDVDVVLEAVAYLDARLGGVLLGIGEEVR